MTDINPKPSVVAQLMNRKMVSDFFDPSIEKVRKSIAVSPLMDERAEEFCQAHGYTFSHWVRGLIAKELSGGDHVG
jgi:hypothetical protein